MDTRKAGKLGGDKLKKKYGKEHFAEIGKKGAKKRWGNKSAKNKSNSSSQM